MYLVDTDICIEFMRNNKEVIDNISKLEDLYISIITLSELFYGIFNSKAKKKHLKALEKFLINISVLNTDFSTAYLFGRIRSELKNKGRFSGDFDIANAAFARSYGLILVTRNVRHYKNIRGIKIISF